VKNVSDPFYLRARFYQLGGIRAGCKKRLLKNGSQILSQSACGATIVAPKKTERGGRVRSLSLSKFLDTESEPQKNNPSDLEKHELKKNASRDLKAGVHFSSAGKKVAEKLENQLQNKLKQDRWGRVSLK
jgi:hypothetical protein